MKKPRNYENQHFYQVLEHHDKNRTYLNAHGWGESPAPLAFSVANIQKKWKKRNPVEEKEKEQAGNAPPSSPMRSTPRRKCTTSWSR